MSSASLPYHLRPHKTVDRRLFIDLLARYERWLPLSDHVYISMGAYPLEDHKLIYRLMGITSLIAFDMDEEIVSRQEFNKPSESCKCVAMKSGDLIDYLDRTLEDCGFDENDGVIFWLDYTEPKKIGEQIREFESLLDHLKPGDIVRVTVNANPSTLGEFKDESGKPITVEGVREKRFQKLKERIGDYLPSMAQADRVSREGLPVILAEAFGVAASKAFSPTHQNMFAPLSIIRYADGQQMLSITGSVVSREELDGFYERIAIQSWPFGSKDWKTVHQLLVPALTVRERLFLERGIVKKTPEQLIGELGFSEVNGIKMDEFIENYSKYYRFYPTLLSADI